MTFEFAVGAFHVHGSTVTAKSGRDCVVLDISRSRLVVQVVWKLSEPNRLRVGTGAANPERLRTRWHPHERMEDVAYRIPRSAWTNFTGMCVVRIMRCPGDVWFSVTIRLYTRLSEGTVDGG
jgi:hypothetical protein